jgi:membrane-associated protease RseP (regulator of RpoE activity)
MMKKMLCVALVMFSIQTAQASENLYESNYKQQNNTNLKSKQANPDTKMYVSNHFDEDNISMLESGYDMMGSSGFESGSIAPDLALEHAKTINADVVLVYSKYASKKSSLSTLQTIKEAAKSTGEIDEDVLKGDAEQYNYYASYWAKLPMPLLGLHVIKLKHKEKDSNLVIEDEGLKVLAVIKDSSAFKAGLKRGDILLKIDGVKMSTPAQLSQAVGQKKGKEVKVSYERDGNLKETSAKLIAQ